MSRLVDASGKPFSPSPVSAALELAASELLELAASELANLTFCNPLPGFTERARIAELRRSCGVEPEKIVIKFRRTGACK